MEGPFSPALLKQDMVTLAQGDSSIQERKKNIITLPLLSLLGTTLDRPLDWQILSPCTVLKKYASLHNNNASYSASKARCFHFPTSTTMDMKSDNSSGNKIN